MPSDQHVGSPRSRVDGRAKVTGAAKYAAEYHEEGLLHGVVASSAIARGRITRIDCSAAEAVPGVVKVFTHENRPSEAWFSYKYQDQVAPPGKPFRPLYDAEILYSGQPIALVVAEDFATADYAASLIEVSFDVFAHETDLTVAQGEAYVPPKKRDGIPPPPAPRGDVATALAGSAARIEQTYALAVEHHNPMEPHATTVVWQDDGGLTVYDKTQGVLNCRSYLANVFGLKPDKIRVLAPFVGGAFGSGLRPQYQVFLAVMAALSLQRSVRVVLSRDQMFTFGYRPDTINKIALGASADGRLQAIRHEAIASTSRFEDYQEDVVNWSGMLYHCDNVALSYKLAQVDTYTPADMRAPGAPTGVFALESAMDELAYALGIDPLEMRLRNDADTEENTGKPYTSKELRAAYRSGAEAFGWATRSAAPRSMRQGRELIGWGVAAGIWEAMMMQTSARAVLNADGTLQISTATSDIGTGTYTILTQIAADALGLAMEDVTVEIGDTTLPFSPLEGGSWTAASAGSAVLAACNTVRAKLLEAALAVAGSPLGNAGLAQVVFSRGRVALADDPTRFVLVADVLKESGSLMAEETAAPDGEIKKHFASNTHSAVFVEVRVDEELGVVRVTRVVQAVAAGKIINPKTARSQIIGGVVFGIGSALHEDSMADHVLGRFMNHNFAEYHIPTNADVPDIDVIFVDEPDDKANPLGVKGLGEIGVVGTAAAIANAIFHATGKRVRSLPITIDKLQG
jgi:xanthine dehydrogenase YagR molybdenum-binding subunit